MSNSLLRRKPALISSCNVLFYNLEQRILRTAHLPLSRSIQLNDSKVQLQLITNDEKNGVELRFNGKPSTQVTSLLNKLGFKYSYRQNMWYGKNTEQKNQFAQALQGALQNERDLEQIEIIPSFPANLDSIEQRNFSCVAIARQSEDSDVLSEEYLLFEPCLKTAEEIVRRFVADAFTNEELTISVQPRTGKKLARRLFAENKIIQSSKGFPKVESLNLPSGESEISNGLLPEGVVDKKANAIPDNELPLEHIEIVNNELELPLNNRPTTDEDLLEELYNMKRVHHLSRSFLKDLGIQHPLKDWHITIGKYRLDRKAVFRFVFDLSLTETTSEASLEN